MQLSCFRNNPKLLYEQCSRVSAKPHRGQTSLRAARALPHNRQQPLLHIADKHHRYKPQSIWLLPKMWLPSRAMHQVSHMPYTHHVSHPISAKSIWVHTKGLTKGKHSLKSIDQQQYIKSHHFFCTKRQLGWRKGQSMSPERTPSCVQVASPMSKIMHCWAILPRWFTGLHKEDAKLVQVATAEQCEEVTSANFSKGKFYKVSSQTRFPFMVKWNVNYPIVANNQRLSAIYHIKVRHQEGAGVFHNSAI